ncbi:MAG: hypothetical protein IJ733_16415 [Lachnospiraceae bacterium]|nr:hypothetical protein [Lachnospiraceae bacterium]
MNLTKNLLLTTLDYFMPNTPWEDFFPLAKTEKIRFCILEIQEERTRLFIHVPSKKELPPLDYALFFNEKEVTIIAGKQKDLERLESHIASIKEEKLSTPSFLCLFLQSFLSEDTLQIEYIERNIAAIEDDILNGSIENFYKKIMPEKKAVARFYRFYNQMMELTEKLIKEKEAEFSKKEIEAFEDYKDHLTKLSDEAKFVREYSLEVQEIYQAELDIRQNNVMKVLTIVATFFFPLSLIAGWYGMNFEYMPELKSPYSYPVVIGVSIAIVLFCFIFFKKKKYW